VLPHVFTELNNRGLDDVLMLVCDGLKGLPEAVEIVWPRIIVQTSSVHNRLWRDRLAGHLRRLGHDLCRRVPSRSSCRPAGPERWRASHRSAGVALRVPGRVEEFDRLHRDFRQQRSAEGWPRYSLIM
jgi:hypothetical protein